MAELKYNIRVDRIDKTKKLLYIDILVLNKFSIYKYSFDVNLINFYIISGYNSKNSID